MGSKKAKKHGASDQQRAEPSSNEPLIPASAWNLVRIGAALVFSGFVVLSFTDTLGRNWASHLSPFLILGGYVVIGVALMRSDPPPPGASEKTT